MILSALYHLFMPRICPMCGSVLRMNEAGICMDCIKQLPRTEEHLHRQNKVEMALADTKGLIRGGGWCFYPKDHPIRKVIHQMKYNGDAELAIRLGELSASEWLASGFFDDIDCIVPIPLHKNKFRQRTYNQAELIAKGISKVTGIPVDSGHLIRTVDNSQQSLKTLEERRHLPNIFELKNGKELSGKHVLLVDDVLTSGTTMLRAIKNLQRYPSCRFSVFVLAVAY